MIDKSKQWFLKSITSRFHNTADFFKSGHWCLVVSVISASFTDGTKKIHRSAVLQMTDTEPFSGGKLLCFSSEDLSDQASWPVIWPASKSERRPKNTHKTYFDSLQLPVMTKELHISYLLRTRKCSSTFACLFVAKRRINQVTIAIPNSQTY